MIWYAMMFNKDKEEQFEAELNMTEYLASFTNSEAVQQARDTRANQKVVSDEDFEMGLRKAFGRDIDLEAEPHSVSRSSNVAPVKLPVVENAPSESHVKKKGSISMADIKKHMGDDIKFYPTKK